MHLDQEKCPYGAEFGTCAAEIPGYRGYDTTAQGRGERVMALDINILNRVFSNAHIARPKIGRFKLYPSARIFNFQLQRRRQFKFRRVF